MVENLGSFSTSVAHQCNSFAHGVALSAPSCSTVLTPVARHHASIDFSMRSYHAVAAHMAQQPGPPAHAAAAAPPLWHVLRVAGSMQS